MPQKFLGQTRNDYWSIGTCFHSAVLTAVMNSSARCFMASLSGTGKMVRGKCRGVVTVTVHAGT